MSETNLTWQKYKNSGTGSFGEFLSIWKLLIVCKDNVSNFFKYFLKKKSQKFFLQKTVGQGQLAKKFFSKNNFFRKWCAIFFTSETF